MGWTVSFEAKGETPTRFDDALDEFLDLLVDRGGAVNSSTFGDRYGATFSVDEDVENAAAAVAVGHDVFTALAEKAGLPAWPVVRADALTFEEQDRELETPNFPELVGVTEVADILGVTRQRASALAKTAGFPAPIAALASGPVWTRPSLNRFVEDWPRKDGRPTLSMLARRLIQSINQQPRVDLTPETHMILATADDVVEDDPYGVLASLARALQGEVERMRTWGRSEKQIGIVQGWIHEAVQAMSGHSAASK